MKTLVQICELLYLIDADWIFAARIDAFYLLILVVRLFVYKDAVFFEIVKHQSAFPLFFGLFLDLRIRVFLSIFK